MHTLIRDFRISLEVVKKVGILVRGGQKNLNSDTSQGLGFRLEKREQDHFAD